MIENNEIDSVYSAIATDHNVEGYRYSIRNENNNDLNLQIEERALQGVEHHRLQQIQLHNQFAALEEVDPGPEALTQAVLNLGFI